AARAYTPRGEISLGGTPRRKPASPRRRQRQTVVGIEADRESSHVVKIEALAVTQRLDGDLGELSWQLRSLRPDPEEHRRLRSGYEVTVVSDLQNPVHDEPDDSGGQALAERRAHRLRKEPRLLERQIDERDVAVERFDGVQAFLGRDEDGVYV